MTKQRSERVQEALRQEISLILQNEIKDPRIGFLTITKVEVAKDLRHANIYFSVLGGAKDKGLALKGLNSANGYIKAMLSDRIRNLRFMPEIAFRIDNSYERSAEIYGILDKLKKEKKDGEGDRGDKKI